MKINAITNYNSHSKKSNNKPVFSARVNILPNANDVISGSYVNISAGPLKILAEKIKPHLEKLNDNLIVNISGAAKSLSFWDLFKSKTPTGLKFDIKIFDDKKYIHDLLQDDKLKKFIDPHVYEGLQNKDKTIDDFARDMRLIFSNCYKYNGSDSVYSRSAKELEEYFEQLMNTYKIGRKR